MAIPLWPKQDKQQIIRGLAHALRTETTYIFAPDMGTNEECMAWIRDEVESQDKRVYTNF